MPPNNKVLAAVTLLAWLAILAVLAFRWWSWGGEPIDRLADEPDRLVVYSVDGPSFHEHHGHLTLEQAEGAVLHGYPVLGQVEVDDPGRRREIVAAFKEAARSNSELQFNCFIPRHAVRTVKAGVTVDVVVCFKCQNYEAYRGDERLTEGGTRAISPAARPLLDQVLADAGVPLARKD